MFFVCLISISQSLFADETSPEWRYSAWPGDNLIQFANRYLLNPDDWRVLQKLNAIKNPKKLQVGQIVRVPLMLVKQAPAPAEVVLVSGQVAIINADKAMQTVSVGQQLHAGTTLTTAQNSRLDVRFADGSVVAMQSNSTMKLDTLSMYSGGGMVDTRLRLQQGKVEAAANPKHVQGNQLQIMTPSAVAAVRGTHFRVSTDADSIKQETLEGNVALSAAGEEVAVKKGFGSLSEGGAPPMPPILLLAAPNTKVLPSKLDALPLTFNMPAQDGAVAWVGQISVDAQFKTVLAENVSQGAALTFAGVPDGQYFLKVRAKDTKGLEGYDAVHIFDLNAQPFAPKIVKPSEAEILRDANPQLDWTAVEQAKNYRVEIAQDADFKNVVENREVSINTYKFDKSLPPGQYFWRLSSLNGDDKGPYGKVNHFSYKPLPIAPDISQLKISVLQNRVFVTTVNPPDGLSYQAILHNEKNHQLSVWSGSDLGATFDFLLKEYGKQTLVMRHVQADGTKGPDAIVEFDAPAP
ncbi:MAG: FecR domain-containing protein [Bdellovibrio sp.]|nr:FecR domain-containing protein [Methylotenera sp.]